MNLSYESVIDIIWPILRKYISDTENDKDKIFTSLKESFEKIRMFLVLIIYFKYLFCLKKFQINLEKLKM